MDIFKKSLLQMVLATVFFIPADSLSSEKVGKPSSQKGSNFNIKRACLNRKKTGPSEKFSDQIGCEKPGAFKPGVEVAPMPDCFNSIP